MMRYERGLVALSGTEADRSLTAYARMIEKIGFARHYHFVHVRTPAQVADDPRSDAQVLEACDTLLKQAFDGAAATHSLHLVIGVRVDSLIEFSCQQRCDVILLGHRRSRSGQRSLARRLAMVAPCSVWLVPEEAPVAISNVMAPIDFSDHSADSLRVAVSLAKSAGLRECSAVHVFSDPSTVRYDERIDEIRRNEQDSFRNFIAPIDLQGIEVEPTFMEANNMARAILHAAKLRDTDLLVMSTRGRSRSASVLLGSVTAQVMSETPVAIFTVKHFGAMMNLFQALQQSHFWARPNPKTN